MKKRSNRERKAMFAKIKKSKKGKRKRAWDYGDNPNIRRSYGEHKTRSKKEEWEKK